MGGSDFSRTNWCEFVQLVSLQDLCALCALCGSIHSGPSPSYFHSHFLPSTNQSSTFFRAQGVLRRKIRLDFTDGLNSKHRTGILRAISAQPCCSTRCTTIASSVTPCNGSRGCEDGGGIWECSNPIVGPPAIVGTRRTQGSENLPSVKSQDLASIGCPTSIGCPGVGKGIGPGSFPRMARMCFLL